MTSLAPSTQAILVWKIKSGAWANTQTFFASNCMLAQIFYLLLFVCLANYRSPTRRQRKEKSAHKLDEWKQSCLCVCFIWRNLILSNIFLLSLMERRRFKSIYYWATEGESLVRQKGKNSEITFSGHLQWKVVVPMYVE